MLWTLIITFKSRDTVKCNIFILLLVFFFNFSVILTLTVFYFTTSITPYISLNRIITTLEYLPTETNANYRLLLLLCLLCFVLLLWALGLQSLWLLLILLKLLLPLAVKVPVSLELNFRKELKKNSILLISDQMCSLQRYLGTNGIVIYCWPFSVWRKYIHLYVYDQMFKLYYKMVALTMKSVLEQWKEWVDHLWQIQSMQFFYIFHIRHI